MLFIILTMLERGFLVFRRRLVFENNQRLDVFEGGVFIFVFFVVGVGLQVVIEAMN